MMAWPQLFFVSQPPCSVPQSHRSSNARPPRNGQTPSFASARSRSPSSGPSAGSMNAAFSISAPESGGSGSPSAVIHGLRKILLHLARHAIGILALGHFGPLVTNVPNSRRPRILHECHVRPSGIRRRPDRVFHPSAIVLAESTGLAWRRMVFWWELMIPFVHAIPTDT